MKTTPHTPARVMIVEDSLVVRQLLAHIITRDPRLILGRRRQFGRRGFAGDRPCPARRHLDGHPLAGHGRARGHPPDHVGTSDADRRDRGQHRGFGSQNLHERASRRRTFGRGEARRGHERRIREPGRDDLHAALHHEPRAGRTATLVCVARAGAAGWRKLAGRTDRRNAAHSPHHRGLHRGAAGARQGAGGASGGFSDSDSAGPAYGRPFHGGLRVLARRHPAARRRGGARTGNPDARSRLCGSRRPAPALVTGWHPPDQREPAACKPETVCHPDVQLGRQVGRPKRARRDFDRHGGGRRPGPLGNAAGRRLHDRRGRKHGRRLRNAGRRLAIGRRPRESPPRSDRASESTGW